LTATGRLLWEAGGEEGVELQRHTREHGDDRLDPASVHVRLEVQRHLVGVDRLAAGHDRNQRVSLGR